MTDPLAEALLAADPSTSYGAVRKLDKLFGARPEVLKAILTLSRDPRHTSSSITNVINEHIKPDSISPEAVRNWIKAQGE
jgi:hypothetical protein